MTKSPRHTSKSTKAAPSAATDTLLLDGNNSKIRSNIRDIAQRLHRKSTDILMMRPPTGASAAKNTKHGLVEEYHKRKRVVLDIKTHPIRGVTRESFLYHYQSLLTNHEIVCDLLGETDCEKTRLLKRLEQMAGVENKLHSAHAYIQKLEGELAQARKVNGENKIHPSLCKPESEADTPTKSFQPFIR